MAEEFLFHECPGIGIASVMARKGVSPEAIGARLGITLPGGPAAVTANGYTALGTGPGSWLVMRDEANERFAQLLRDQLEGLASVSDQSSGYAILRLSGPDARVLLQRGAAVDFHPDSFRPGSVATTVIAHIGTIIWQVDDLPTYDIAFFRSLSGSFRHWLDQAVAAL